MKRKMLYLYPINDTYNMLKTILIAIGVILVYSYAKYKFKSYPDKKFAAYWKGKMLAHPDDVHILLTTASALTLTQQYRQAADIYEGILNDPVKKESLSPDTLEKVNLNLKFCYKPLPWSSECKDHSVFTYAHFFMLRRYGNKRYLFITDEDALEYNAWSDSVGHM